MQTIICGRWNRHSSRYAEAKNLWSVRNKFGDDAKAGDERLRGPEDALTTLLLGQLTKLGVSIIGNGSFRWDSVFDIARKIDGCGGFAQLTRIPQTNHFHRQPITDSTLTWTSPILSEDLRFARNVTSQPVVMCLPGPYSLARQTQNVGGLGLPKLAREYAGALRHEIKSLLAGGAHMVRLEEPQILDHPEDWQWFRNLMNDLLSDIETERVALATWFGSINDFVDYFALPFGTFFLDFVEGKRSLASIPTFPKDKKLVAGVFDARHPHSESEEELNGVLGEIFCHVDRERVLLSTNTDLDFLPWDIALEKVSRLVAFAKNREEKIVPYSLLKTDYLPHGSPVPEKGFSTPVSVPRLFTVPFPTSAVGSYPQNDEVRKARVALKKKEMPEIDYRQIVERRTREWMTFQEEIGITCPVGGEFLREDMAAYFGLRMGGETCDFVSSYENRRYHPIQYRSAIRPPSEPMTTEDFLFLQSLSKQPVKETITGPATMADWGLIANPKYYKDRLAFRMAFAEAIRREIEKMIEVGVKVLQIDEPALTTKMKEFPWDIEAIRETIRGFEDRLYLILHVCYSDMEALDAAFPTILGLPFHQIHIEMANRGYAPLRLIEKYGFGGKDIGLGVIDVHTNRIESTEEIVDGVRRVRQFFKPEQIWITPDCGLKDRSDEVAKAKLRVMTGAAKICREKLV